MRDPSNFIIFDHRTLVFTGKWQMVASGRLEPLREGLWDPAHALAGVGTVKVKVKCAYWV